MKRFIKKIKIAIAKYIFEDLSKIESFFNIIFLLLIGGWFIRELTGLFDLGNLNFIYNLITLCFALIALRFNKRTKNKAKILAILKENFSFKKDFIIIVLIVIFLASALSVLFWDLPYHYHPGDDEYVVPSALMSEGKFSQAINNPNHSQNPKYDNQHLMYYILTPYFFLAKPIANVFYNKGEFFYSSYFFLARLLNYVLAALVLLINYASAKILFNRKIALFTAVILMLSKLILLHALFMRSDILLTLLASIIFFLFVLRIKLDYINYALLGILVGLGASLKPYSLFFFIPVLYLLVEDFRIKYSISIFLTNLTKFFSWLFLMFHFGRFYHNFFVLNLGSGFNQSMDTAGSGFYGLYPTATISFIDKLLFSFRIFYQWNGTMFLLSLLIAIVLIVYNFGKKEFRILFFSWIPFFLYMGNNIVQGGKYLLPIYPLIVISVSTAILLINRRKVLKTIFVSSILLLTTLEIFYYFGAEVNSLRQKDNRTAASEFVENNLTSGSKISLIGNISWQKPYINSKTFSLVDVNNNPEYIIVNISEFYSVYYYGKNKHLYLDSDWSPQEPPDNEKINFANQLFDKSKSLTVLDSRYELFQEFAKEQRFLGLTRNDYYQNPASWRVWSVTNPMPIRIYKLVK